MEKDEELIAQYLSGYEHALAELIERHVKSVYGFALRTTGSQSEAEDVAQESFLKAWKNLKRFDPKKARFKTWLMHIVRNTAIDSLRKKKATLFSQYEDEGAEEIPDEMPLPDEVAAHAEDVEALKRALEKLSLPYREILLLYNGNDFSLAEAASILEIPVNTAKSRYRRALEALRETLVHPKS